MPFLPGHSRSKVTKKSGGARKFNRPWWDDEVRAAVKERRRLHDKWKHDGGKDALLQHRDQRRRITEMVIKKRRGCWEELLATLSDDFQNNVGLFHANLPAIMGRKQAAVTIDKVTDERGATVSDEASKRAAVAAFYGKLAQKVEVSPVLTSPTTLPKEGGGSEEVTTRYDDDFYTRTTNRVKAIRRLNRHCRWTSRKTAVPFRRVRSKRCWRISSSRRRVVTASRPTSTSSAGRVC